LSRDYVVKISTITMMNELTKKKRNLETDLKAEIVGLVVLQTPLSLLFYID